VDWLVEANVSKTSALKYLFFKMVLRSEVKRPLGRLRHRWKDNIKMNLKDIL
jgi:hypothetical protein